MVYSAKQADEQTSGFHFLLHSLPSECNGGLLWRDTPSCDGLDLKPLGRLFFCTLQGRTTLGQHPRIAALWARC